MLVIISFTFLRTLFAYAQPCMRTYVHIDFHLQFFKKNMRLHHILWYLRLIEQEIKFKNDEKIYLKWKLYFATFRIETHKIIQNENNTFWE